MSWAGALLSLSLLALLGNGSCQVSHPAGSGRQGVASSLPAAGVQEKCWLSNYTGMMNTFLGQSNTAYLRELGKSQKQEINRYKMKEENIHRSTS